MVLPVLVAAAEILGGRALIAGGSALVARYGPQAATAASGFGTKIIEHLKMHPYGIPGLVAGGVYAHRSAERQRETQALLAESVQAQASAARTIERLERRVEGVEVSLAEAEGRSTERQRELRRGLEGLSSDAISRHGRLESQIGAVDQRLRKIQSDQLMCPAPSGSLRGFFDTSVSSGATRSGPTLWQIPSYSLVPTSP